MRLASFFKTPEITLKYETRPAKGSARVLKTKSETGSESFTLRSTSAPWKVAVPGAALGGGGEILEREVQDQVAGDIVQGRGAHDRENAPLAHGVAEAVV